MKKISVCLQSPISSALDSAYYKYLIENPPQGIKYLIHGKKYSVITSQKKFIRSFKFKTYIRKIFNRFYFSLPNFNISRKGNYDLIHCAHCLSLNRKPWVADIEAQMSFVIGCHKNFLTEYLIKKLLLSYNCKKILPWTNFAKNEIINRFKNDDINNKIEVVYPAVPLIEYKKREHELTITFVARYFWQKGGLIALDVFDQLKKKYKINTYFISDVPDELKVKYKNINFYDFVPQNELFDYFYPTTDIFIYPSFVDTFGFSLLEAMSFGLPIVTVDNPTRREVIEDGKNGFIISHDGDVNYYNLGDKEKMIVKELVRVCSILIENKNLRDDMFRYSREIIRNGKFSLKQRNLKLMRIYKEALEND